MRRSPRPARPAPAPPAPGAPYPRHLPPSAAPRGAALVTGVVVLALAGCGSATTEPPVGPAAQTTRTSPVGPAVAGSDVVTRGIVMQSSPDHRVELCVGPVATSYPPQCAGPGLAGEFDWTQVEAQEQAGVRWTDTVYVAVGTYDRESDTLSLTHPLATEPPEGVVLPEPEDVEFPQLCDDPFRGGDPAQVDDPQAQQALQERLESMDDYVASWVSDGAAMVNVLVTGDAEAAHADLRQVWRGGLCVEQRDLPTAADRDAAQAELARHADDIALLGASSGVSGRLDVEVVVADDRTVARVHELVAPWLDADDVRVDSALIPLGRG